MSIDNLLWDTQHKINEKNPTKYMKETTIINEYEYVYRDSDLPWNAYIIPPLLEMLSEVKKETKEKIRVLDLGCGNGSISNAIALQGYEVVGVEDSVSGIKIAQESFPNCQFIQANIFDLPYTQLGKSFDVVFSSEVIEHLPYGIIKRSKKMFKTSWYFNFNYSLSWIFEKLNYCHIR